MEYKRSEIIFKEYVNGDLVKKSKYYVTAFKCEKLEELVVANIEEEE